MDSCIYFHKLADMRLSRMQSGGLTPEEEEKYNAYLSWPGTLPAVFREDFLALETKKMETPLSLVLKRCHGLR